MYAQQDVDLDDEKLSEMSGIVKEQILEEMINETLILQAAANEGITAAEEDIQAAIDSRIDEEDLTPSIEALYDQYSEQITDMPELEEVRIHLEEELIETKRDQLIQYIIDALRSSGEILTYL